MMTARWTIHRLTDVPETAPLLARWLQEEWPHAYDEERANSVIARLGNRNRLPLGLVACTRRLSPIGMTAVVKGTTPLAASVAVMVTLYVAPAYRRRGVGSALCCRAVAEARRLGWRRLGAYTVDKARFYGDLGWRVVTRATMPSNPLSRRRVWYVEHPDELEPARPPKPLASFLTSEMPRS